MKFDLNIWWDYRNKAKIIGDYILAHKECTYDKEGNFKKYKLKMDEEEFQYNIKKITAILKECSNYLMACGMYMPKPLWKFSIDDTKTWKSHRDFAFEHLLE